MRIVYYVIFFSLISSLKSIAQAQGDFAKLEKNVNIRAKGLTHQLNAAKDTLILKSKSLINKVYSVSMDYKREINLSVHKKHINIPISNLSLGKHVFVVVQSKMRIVFVVRVLRENELLFPIEEEELIAAKNEDK